MKVLDLFCGGGGAAMGLWQAGARCIMGVDNVEQAEYPFFFTHADVLKLSRGYLSGYGFIWVSPPCQAYSYAAARWRNSGKVWDDLIGATREMLLDSGKPFVIENVPGAPVRKDLVLCGEMFGIKVIRHRWIEIHGFQAEQPEHIKHRGMVKDGFYVTVAGNGGNYAGHNFCKLNDLPEATQLETWQYAMGIDWIASKKTLREAVPPAYSRYIFSQFLKGTEV